MKNKEQKKYYKVVSVSKHGNDTVLHSARADDAVSYKENEWTIAPNNTRLFVFDDLKDAKRFSCAGEVVYECKIIGGIKGKGADKYNSINEYWNIFNKELKKRKKFDVNELMEQHSISLSPYDAVLVKKLKLIKKVA
jgi:hypothetical protein